MSSPWFRVFFLFWYLFFELAQVGAYVRTMQFVQQITLKYGSILGLLNTLFETLSEFELSLNVIKVNNDFSSRIVRNKVIDFYLLDDFHFVILAFGCKSLMLHVKMVNTLLKINFFNHFYLVFLFGVFYISSDSIN